VATPPLPAPMIVKEEVMARDRSRIIAADRFDAARRPMLNYRAFFFVQAGG
jgi:hypothetical protein